MTEKDKKPNRYVIDHNKVELMINDLKEEE